MLRLPPSDPARPDEAYALALLVDLARLLPADDPAVPAVGVVVREGDALEIGSLRTRGFGIEPGDGEVRVAGALLAAVLAVAGAAVEQGTAETDRHGRVPSVRNPVVGAGLEGEPVLAEAAAALRSAVVRAAGRRPVALLAPWPEGRRWAVAVTHDLDVVDRWPGFTLLRLAELARRGHLGRAGRVVGAALGAVGRDPVWDGVRHVLAVEKRLGITSTWFILCGDPTIGTVLAGDLTYAPEGRRASRILRAVAEGGHEIGLHGSFATYADSGRLAEQRARLERLTAVPVDGVRQHYLRMRPGVTQAAMAAAGFEYDATYGFPDRQGFRLGVGDVVPGWDQRGRVLSGLDEVPLVWMDRAASKYRGVEDPEAWVADALALAERCRRAEGLWVGLWHPNLTAPLGFPGAEAAFVRLTEQLMARQPHVGRLRELTAWRRARRAARARGILPDGRLRIAAAPGISLEGPDGRPLPVTRE
jgi:peptidoglycan/xylan/chitin deacetylase (PgdA/CDA1 family)